MATRNVPRPTRTECRPRLTTQNSARLRGTATHAHVARIRGLRNTTPRIPSARARRNARRSCRRSRHDATAPDPSDMRPLLPGLVLLARLEEEVEEQVLEGAAV